MNKTISITLNGLVFNVEEDAYNRLHSYLEALKSHFGGQEYGKEVVSDIESRIAEQFSSVLRNSKKEVINLSEVETIIKSMGTVEDLAGTESKKSASLAAAKRLYRNPDDQIVAGVASGIASYFDIDPLLPRLLFALLAFASGIGVFLYILLWIIVPEAKTSSQKLEMKGDAVNVANLEETRKAQGDKKKFSVLRYFIQEVFYLIGRFFRALGPVIAAIVGTLMSVAAFAAIFGLSLVGSILFFNPNSQYIDPVVAQVFTGSQYPLVIVSAYVAAIVPAIAALILGISLARRKNSFTAPVTTILGIIWLGGALTFGFMAAGAAPKIEAAVRDIENQPMVTKEFNPEKFDRIQAERDQEVKITKGIEYKVVVRGREEEMEDINLDIDNGRLVLEQTNDSVRFCLICINRPLIIEITTPELIEIVANNASTVAVSGFDVNSNLRIKANGAARIEYSGNVNELEVELNNASRLTIEGTGQTMRAEVSGASRLIAEDYQVSKLQIRATNASRADVHVTDEIRGEASGASRLNYSGNPEIEEVNARNAGEIQED